MARYEQCSLLRSGLKMAADAFTVPNVRLAGDPFGCRSSRVWIGQFSVDTATIIDKADSKKEWWPSWPPPLTVLV